MVAEEKLGGEEVDEADDEAPDDEDADDDDVSVLGVACTSNSDM